VALKEVLQPIAALAGRWRKLELAAWHGLLDRTVDAFAEGELRRYCCEHSCSLFFLVRV